MPLIELSNVSKRYKLAGDTTVNAVENANLQVDQGEFVVIVGRSGSGKSTLLSLIGGLTKPTSGSVKIEGTDIWSMADTSQSILRAEKIGYVFQIPSLLPTMTVLDNMRLPSMFSKDNYRVGERALELLSLVKIPEKVDVFPAQLSVGQQKRVALARALMNKPKILLADEPTSDLDKTTEIEIMELISEIHKTGPRTIIMVTHNLELMRYGTSVYEMVSGVLKKHAKGSLPA